MKNIPNFIWVLIAFVGLVGTAYAGIFSDTWRYKMTVVVETPEGIKTGSAVREVKVVKGLQLTSSMHDTIEVKGEAVVVDLGKRGVLFAVMFGHWGVDYAYMVALDAFPSREKTPIGTKVILTSHQYPMLVRFRDLNDPRTVEAMYPTKNPTIKNVFSSSSTIDFEGRFGKGVKLKEIIVELTNDPVTEEINKWLPWFRDRKNAKVKGYIGGTSEKWNEDPTGTYLTSGVFSQGEK